MNTEAKERVIPFWFWNDDKLDKDKMSHQMDEIYGKGIREVIIHPRFGLRTYLDREWFFQVGCALEHASDLGMRIWFADEKDWPSGTAGGRVTDKNNDEYRARAAKVDHNGKLMWRNSQFHPAYTFGSYVDVLSGRATGEFIGRTHQQYYNNFPGYFGKEGNGVIAGFFCDEPGMYQNLFGVVDGGMLPYTDGIIEYYQKINGVPFKRDFPHIWGGQDWKNRTARLRYFQVLKDFYTLNFLRKLHDWCFGHGALLIGHVLEEENPLNAIKSQADPFWAMANFDWATYDLIGEHLPQKQIIAAKLAKSVARTYGKPEVAAETFGGFGWGLTPDAMRNIGKWQTRNGTTVWIPHALFSSLDGSRRFDAPPSFFEEPYWSEFGEIAQSFRDQVGSGKDGKRAVYYPTKAIQAAYNPGNEVEAWKISEALRQICSQLESASTSMGVDLDFEILNDDGVLGSLPSFDHIYLPRATVIPVKVLNEIARFSANGGEVIFYDGLPQFPELEDEQGVFNRHLEKIKNGNTRVLEGKKTSRYSLESLLASPKAEGRKYLVWHTLSSISPELDARYSAVNGKVQHVLKWMDRRLVGIDRAINIAKKIKNYFFK